MKITQSVSAIIIIFQRHTHTHTHTQAAVDLDQRWGPSRILLGIPTVHELHTCVVRQCMRLTTPVLTHNWYASTATSTIITDVLQSVHKHREASWGIKFIGK